MWGVQKCSANDLNDDDLIGTLTLNWTHYHDIGHLKSGFRSDSNSGDITFAYLGNYFDYLKMYLEVAATHYNNGWKEHYHIEKRFRDLNLNLSYSYVPYNDSHGIAVNGRYHDFWYNIGYNSFSDSIYLGTGYRLNRQVSIYGQAERNYDSWKVHSGLSINVNTGTKGGKRKIKKKDIIWQE